ncbi:MAG TPA: Gfo/Idh/MocA family oxidoreductase [Pyrinomonadaceae bacterium]|nr:Gfo/Idh/MocA family oxidoreductase [Pyrinomonadaceae bacterium]
MSRAARQISVEAVARRPRLGFVGLGWIGRNRLRSVVEAGVAEIAAIHDVQADAVAEAQKLSGEAAEFSDFRELLNHDLDGVVIATPNCFHAEQSIAALERGIAVFCQKPLGRNAAETRQIVNAARNADRLLGVDLSYRAIPAMQTISELVESGELGNVFAVDARFHNGYGPDKPWFRDYRLSGGGCVLDLGSHLIDLALRPLGFPGVTRVQSSLFVNGKRKDVEEVEDYGVAMIETELGVVINLSCCWNMHIGRDADIEVAFYGTRGGARLRNVDGSFYDFIGERFSGTKTEVMSSSNDWGGLATIEWVKRLGVDGRFDPEAERFVAVAEVIDGMALPQKSGRTLDRVSTGSGSDLVKP